MELLLLDIAAAIALALRLALAHGRLWGISGHVGRVEMLVDLSLLVEDRDGDRRRAIDGIRRQRVGLTGNGEAAKRQRECARP